MDKKLWDGIGTCFRHMDRNSQVRVCVSADTGKHFCAGIDMKMLQQVRVQSDEIECEGRKRQFLLDEIQHLQFVLNEIER